MLVGQSDGTYAPQATSTLGLSTVATFLDLTDTPGSYTAGSLLFTSGSAVTEDNAGLFWDDGNDRLGIGTASPQASLVIDGTDSAFDLLRVYGDSANNFASIGFSGPTAFISAAASAVDSTALIFRTANSGVETNALRIDAAQRVGILDDAADFRLEIAEAVSDGYFGISSTASGDGDVLIVDSAGDVGIGTTTLQAGLTLGAGVDFSQYEDDSDLLALSMAPDAFGGDIDIMRVGSTQIRLDGSGGAIFNEQGLGHDFRAEGLNDEYTFYIDSLDDRVAIGTSSPQGKLHVAEGSSGASPNPNVDSLVIEGDGNAGISILSRDDRGARIYLGTPSEAAGAILDWDYDGDELTFGTNKPASDLTIQVAGSEVARFTAGGFLGVGTTSPAGQGHFYEGPSGATANGTANQLVMESSASSGFSILTPNNAFGRIMFGDNDDSTEGRIEYSHADESMAFRVERTPVVTMFGTAGGLMGVGTTTPIFTLDVGGDFRVGEQGNSNVLFVDASNGRVAVGTTTPASRVHIYEPNATSTAFINSGGAGLGGEIILEDTDGTGCTSIAALNGVLDVQSVACPSP